MRNTKRINIILWFLLTVALLLSGCINSEQVQQSIIDTFASFEGAEDYVFVVQSPDRLYVRGDYVELEDLTYEDRPCHYISTTTKCAYFFAYHSGSNSTVDLLSMSYQTLEVSLVDTIEAEKEITRGKYYNGEVYFVLWDQEAAPQNAYLIYNLATAQTRNAAYDSVSSDIFDNFQSEKYTVTCKDKNYLLEKKLLVKNNVTGEEKTVEYALLKTCEEGQKIFELGDIYGTDGAFDWYEHNGEIYIVYVYLVDGFLGYPCCAYVMKYDFEGHTMQYYTSVFMKDFPEGSINDFRIPE